MKKMLWLLVLAPVLSAVMIGVHSWQILNYPYQGAPQILEIAPGEGFASVNYRLYKKGLIRSPRLFHYYARYKNWVNSFKVGTYEIKSGLSSIDMLELFVKGIARMHTVVIPEGKNMFEIGKMLEEAEVTTYTEFIKACRNPNILQSLGIFLPFGDPKWAQTVEGYLYPDTYKFSPNTPAHMVIKTMVNQFKKKTNDLDFSQSKYSPHEIIILASIVEKETGAAHERPMIAGVYLNRLKKPMRLQADPTTIYGIYENFDGNLKKKHLLEKTPYNTYKMSGLPIGPIANPGLAAIEATLNPAKHAYLFFVSHNDGTHEFTRTYKEHLKAVKKYQQTRSNRVGKSWRDLKKAN